jgi:hypothetical protein
MKSKEGGMKRKDCGKWGEVFGMRVNEIVPCENTV